MEDGCWRKADFVTFVIPEESQIYL